MLSRLPFAAILACTFAFSIASAANAATVTISPGGNVTLNGVTSARFTLNTARRTINCTTIGGSARLVTANAGSFPLGITTNLLLTFRTCTMTGGLSLTLTCGNGGWAVTSRTISSETPSTGSLSCTVSLSASCSVRIGGSFTGSYSNSTGWLEVNSPSGQTIMATGSNCATLPNDSSVTFGDSLGGTVLYNISPSTSMTAS